MPRDPSDIPPAFIQSSPLLREAFAMALAAHHGWRRRGDTDIEHPVAVAALLYEHEIADEEVLAAALLHDVIEETDTELSEIGTRFGPEVERLVAEMTENVAIEPYSRRKAEHRERVARDGCAAAIYAADKLASTRELRQAGAETGRERLEHYQRTLELLFVKHPDLPFLDELGKELRLLTAPRADPMRSYV
jgi:(p)ppGpp synthase/HD superfamily hydrolase